MKDEDQKSIQETGFLLQQTPPIYVTALPGKWLLKHSTPVWRIDDPEKGFQRVVKEERARAIAATVLDQRRTFPNAIVLATDKPNLNFENDKLQFAKNLKFLVVDGQHRLWAQNFSEFEAEYACTIHCNLNEVDMARLFLEINNNQKRVPSSLRWDLVRLVRPEDDQFSITAAELVFELSTNEASPLYQRIDLTGEQKEIALKQASLAPEFRLIVSNRLSPLKDISFDSLCEILIRYIAAIKSLDSDGWNDATSPFYSARILRTLIKLLPEIIKKIGIDPLKIRISEFKTLLTKINKSSIDLKEIRAKQGVAGMKEIYDEIRTQIFS